MYIAVICGGLSAERDVSISSGTGAARALRARGHKVALVDLFLGNPSAVNDPRSVFTSDAGDSVYSVRETEPDLDKIRAQRGGKGLIGPGVIEICRAADIAFLALHGAEGENGKLQACLDLYGVPYTGSGYLGSALAMDKELSKILFRSSGIPTPPGVTLHRGDLGAGEHRLSVRREALLGRRLRRQEPCHRAGKAPRSARRGIFRR